MELYQLKMVMRGDFHDQINKFSQLVSQLLNANDKLSNEEQVLLLLASLPRSFKNLVQTLLMGRSTLNLDEVIVAFRETYNCSENDHVQVRYKQMKEDLKKLRDMNKDSTNSQANVVKNVEDEDDVFLAINDEVAKTKWVMNSAASKHICKD
ncbi:Retrovirus-related Pol polyprotein from transposon TNT 1-94 [Glycine soja]